MPTRAPYAHTSTNAYYGTQCPQAAAAALAAMMQAAHTQAQAQGPQLPNFQQPVNSNYHQQSMTTPLQTQYSAQPPASASAQQQTGHPFAMQPMQMSAPQWDFQKPQFQAPTGPPQSLTEGMPDPAAIDRQKAGYVKTLEEQRQHYINALDSQKKEYLDSIHGQAEQLKKQMLMQLDQQVKDQTIALENKYNEQVMTLNAQLHQQRAVLEQEAIKLKGEYQQKHLEEQAMNRQYQLQKEQREMEEKYASDMQQLKQQQYQMAQQIYGSSGASQMQGPSSYTEAHQQTGVGSYVPPVTMPAQQGSYVPPPVGTGSCVPPATTIQTHPCDQRPSWVPPVAGQGSYVPPVTVHEQQGPCAPPATGSYVPPTQGSYVPPTQGSYVPPAVESYVASPASAAMLRDVTNGAITQPQAPVYYGKTAKQAPTTQHSNVTSYSCAPTVHSNVSTTPVVSYSHE